MYTRGQARREASASADDTEEEYVEVPETSSNMIPSSQVDWFPRTSPVTATGMNSQTFEITETTESSCEETDRQHSCPQKSLQKKIQTFI